MKNGDGVLSPGKGGFQTRPYSMRGAAIYFHSNASCRATPTENGRGSGLRAPRLARTMFPMKDTNPPALIAPTIPNVEATPHTPVSHA